MTPSTPWLQSPTSPLTGGVRLFCFPYAGGGAAIFHGWDASLAGIDLFRIRLPGREGRIREVLRTTFDPLIRELASALGPHLVPPFAFYGHSMGALLAFELCRELRRRAAPLPGVLIASGAASPADPRVRVKRMAELSDAAFVRELETYGGTSRQVLDDPELRELLLPIVQADFKVAASYVSQPEPPLACDLHVHIGQGDSLVAAGAADGWRAETAGDFRLVPFAGDHFFIHSAQALVLAELRRALGPLAGAPGSAPAR